MQILKHGKMPNCKFVCEICGCEFIASADEYSVEKNKWGRSYSCECPECGWVNVSYEELEVFPNRADCSKTEDYFAEHDRMCGCAKNCDACPFSIDNNDFVMPCDDYEREHTKDAIIALQKWSDTHPKKGG